MPLIMKKPLLAGFFAFAGFFFNSLYAQNEYRYSVDLNNVQNDSLSVELLVPKMQKATVTFSLPKIIPGTYSISDYGRFVENIKFFDSNNKELAFEKIDENSWKVKEGVGPVDRLLSFCV